MPTLALTLLLSASPDGGVSLLSIMGRAFDDSAPEIVSLGKSPLYGATTIETAKIEEDHHWAGCGYAMYFHELTVSGPDAGWTGFLGYSGSSSCPTTEWNDVDRAKLLRDGTIRITSGFRKEPRHRAGKGLVINLVPYQDFAVPREIGPIKRLPQQGCLEPVERPGVFFEMSAWCTQTTDAITCLALRNRCNFAIDAEGHAFTFDGYDYEVKRGCVIPPKEHALIVSETDHPDALTFWVARCPAADRPSVRPDGGTRDH